MAVEFAQCLYSIAAEPRRNWLKPDTYVSLCELLDRTPFVNGYYRALAECGPLAPSASEASGHPGWHGARPGPEARVELKLYPRVG